MVKVGVIALRSWCNKTQIKSQFRKVLSASKMQKQVCVTKDYFIDYVNTGAKPSSQSKKLTCQPINVVVKVVTIDSNWPPLTASELAQILRMDAEGQTASKKIRILRKEHC